MDDPQITEPYRPGEFGGILPAHAFEGETDISGYWNDLIPLGRTLAPRVLEPGATHPGSQRELWEPERMPLVDW